MTDHDYGRPSEGHEGIRDWLDDAHETVNFFKSNRSRIERLMDFAERMADAFDGSWLAKVLGVKPRS